MTGEVLLGSQKLQVLKTLPDMIFNTVAELIAYSAKQRMVGAEVLSLIVPEVCEILAGLEGQDLAA